MFLNYAQQQKRHCQPREHTALKPKRILIMIKVLTMSEPCNSVIYRMSTKYLFCYFVPRYLYVIQLDFTHDNPDNVIIYMYSFSPSFKLNVNTYRVFRVGLC